jgi:hypothetical protein
VPKQILKISLRSSISVALPSGVHGESTASPKPLSVENLYDVENLSRLEDLRLVTAVESSF